MVVGDDASTALPGTRVIRHRLGRRNGLVLLERGIDHGVGTSHAEYPQGKRVVVNATAGPMPKRYLHRALTLTEPSPLSVHIQTGPVGPPTALRLVLQGASSFGSQGATVCAANRWASAAVMHHTRMSLPVAASFWWNRTSWPVRTPVPPT